MLRRVLPILFPEAPATTEQGPGRECFLAKNSASVVLVTQLRRGWLIPSLPKTQRAFAPVFYIT